jgi:hypothetical protein
MRSTSWPLLLISAILLLAGACTPAPTPEAEPATAALTPTPTPTSTPVVATELPATATPSPTPTKTPTPGAIPGATPEDIPGACAGLSGELEAQILVGPAEVVGLEPVAVGSIPFTVTGDQPPYAVQGGTTISYQDTLQREWGTYSVALQMEMTLDGVCTAEDGTPVLDLTVTSSGEQTVEVSAGGFQGSYPWSGENSFNLSLPVQEGATATGEGWTFVLHLD